MSNFVTKSQGLIYVFRDMILKSRQFFKDLEANADTLARSHGMLAVLSTKGYTIKGRVCVFMDLPLSQKFDGRE
jgi:hypothetical protein